MLLVPLGLFMLPHELEVSAFPFPQDEQLPRELEIRTFPFPQDEQLPRELEIRTLPFPQEEHLVYQFTKAGKGGRRAMVIGHRGGPFGPENTIKTF